MLLLWAQGRGLFCKHCYPKRLREQVTGSLVYRVAASKLYPVISPYADPALAKVTHSALYASVVDHLKPVPAAPGSPDGRHHHFLSCAQC